MLGPVHNKEEETWFLEGLGLNITNEWCRAELGASPRDSFESKQLNNMH